MAKNFVLNYQQLHEIDITPLGATRTYARLAAGLTGGDPSNNEKLDQTTYLDGAGYGESAVIGAQFIVSFSGHRVVGDAAQDFIASLEHALGDDRVTNYRYTDKNGKTKTGVCSICNVKIGGGDAGAKTAISFEVHLAGKPAVNEPTTAATLTSTVAAGSVSGTTKFTATPGSTNTLKYKLLAATPGTVYGSSYVENAVAYTSAADIPATAGQFLAMFEVDSNSRVVKYSGVVLQAADIKA